MTKRPSIVSIESENGVCQVDPRSYKGRQIQKFQMTFFPLVPSVGLLIYAIIQLSGGTMDYIYADKMKGLIETSHEAVKVIFAIQEEGGVVTTYVGTNGSELLGSLDEYYRRTDLALSELHEWPTGDDMLKYPTKEEFVRHLESHREKLILEFTSIDLQLKFYEGLVTFLIDWVLDATYDGLEGPIWQAVLTYENIIKSGSYYSTEGILGVLYYIVGSLSPDVHIHALQELELGEDYLTYAQMHDENAAEVFNENYLENEVFVNALTEMRQEIALNENQEPDLYKGVTWFRKSTYFLDILILMREKAIEAGMQHLSKDKTNSIQQIILSLVMISFVLGFVTPFVVMTASLTTSTLHGYARNMEAKTFELRKEKRKTEKLLNQMLPRMISYRLRSGLEIEAEQFAAATIFFSDIPDFQEISTNMPPMQVVAFLNDIYSFLDDRIEKYDVYKVETIGCVYMVVSGVPMRNGNRHASEIARMALDIVSLCQTFLIPTIPDKRLELRIGCHTGPVVAGVVGNKAPRYCLFGDTVNTAARMQTNGMSRKIHISEYSYQELVDIGGFNMEHRGMVTIKGKGDMNTYWLVSREGGSQTLTPSLRNQSRANTYDSF